MKNLKKLSRIELRSLKGAGPIWSCNPNPCPRGSCCLPGRWPDIPRACYICADS
ncbi:bacteriocin-like protein [Chryseobacterium endalhagicum]